jgi:hypothetical protein
VQLLLPEFADWPGLNGWLLALLSLPLSASKRGVFAAPSSRHISENSFQGKYEGAANTPMVLSGIPANNSPTFYSSSSWSGVTRSRSVQILDF